jgi:hypothetical protein
MVLLCLKYLQFVNLGVSTKVQRRQQFEFYRLFVRIFKWFSSFQNKFFKLARELTVGVIQEAEIIGLVKSSPSVVIENCTKIFGGSTVQNGDWVSFPSFRYCTGESDVEGENAKFVELSC